ncbi:MAG: arsenite methyltransferase [Bacteroidia bacterium]
MKTDIIDTTATPEEIKQMVREKYGKIVENAGAGTNGSCCGCGPTCGDGTYTIMSEDYTQLEGYTKDADLELGCGIPVASAAMKKGDVVVDLGSGAGNDCFVARSIVGEDGRVIGIDMTEGMVKKAKENAQKLGYNNVEFRTGDIENIPMTSNLADVVISNCVLNLVPDKQKAFAETFRILKPGGHFSISDVVLNGELPLALQTAAELYAGCVSGAIQENEYLQIIRNTGFTNIRVDKRKPIELPDELLNEIIGTAGTQAFKASGAGIYSITVYAEKPAATCTPGGGCC